MYSSSTPENTSLASLNLLTPIGARRRLACKPFLILAGAVAALAAGAISPVQADTYETFNLAWSGAAYGDPAEATGSVTLDLTNFENGTSGRNSLVTENAVTDFSLTISGASAGNGTFSLSDFEGGSGDLFFDTNKATLDLSQELVGQATSGSPYGTPNGNGGDFNFSTNGNDPTAPNGVFYFTIQAGGGSGDRLSLTSFAPAPEPSTWALLGLGAAGLVLTLRRRTARV